MLRLRQNFPSVLKLQFRLSHYATLGVASSVDAKAIKKAFRNKSLECHPDKFPGNAAKESEFKTLSEAYQILSDKKRRSDYDLGQKKGGGSSGAWEHGNAGAPFSGGPGFQQKQYKDYGQRQYRTEGTQYERNEQWSRVYEELNRKRHEQYQTRNPDFGDFMNGRRNTDFKDFRKWYKEPASDFEAGGKSRTFADKIFEPHTRGQTRQRFEDMHAQRVYEQTQQHKKKEELKKLLNFLVFALILTLFMDAFIAEKNAGENFFNRNYDNSSHLNVYHTDEKDLSVAELVRRRQQAARAEKEAEERRLAAEQTMARVAENQTELAQMRLELEQKTRELEALKAQQGATTFDSQSIR